MLPRNVSRTWVLVVDDNENFLMLMRRILMAGIPNTEVVTAREGTEALRQLRNRHFSVVVCDVMMPGMTGIELLEAVNNEEIAPGTPFLFMSAVSTREVVRQVFEVGAVDFIQKPYSSEEVIAKVRNLARISELQTKLYQSQQELLQANRNLKMINRLQSEVVHRIIHDIRSPLSGIRGLATLMTEQRYVSTIDTARQFASEIADSVRLLLQKMSGTIEKSNYLSVAKLNRNYTDVPLAGVIRGELVKLDRLARDRNIVVEIELDENRIVRAEHEKITELFANLFMSVILAARRESVCVIAVDMPDGSPFVRVVTEFKVAGSLEAFSTLEEPTSEAAVGEGSSLSEMRLSLVRKYVEYHDGDISFEHNSSSGFCRLVIIVPEK